MVQIDEGDRNTRSDEEEIAEELDVDGAAKTSEEEDASECLYKGVAVRDLGFASGALCAKGCETEERDVFVPTDRARAVRATGCRFHDGFVARQAMNHNI